MQHQTSGTIQKYLMTKGLSNNHIDYFEGLRLENGSFTNYDKCSWLREPGMYHLCKFKKNRYANEGVNEALFIPFRDIKGTLQGLSIRLMGQQKHDSWIQEGISKTSCLFNIDKAYSYIIKLNRVFVTEDSYSAMAMATKGFPNTISILGTNFSQIHYTILSSLTNNIILCLDNDNAGISSMRDIYNRYGNKVNIYMLDIDKDPDEYLVKNTSSDIIKNIKCFHRRRNGRL